MMSLPFIFLMIIILHHNRASYSILALISCMHGHGAFKSGISSIIKLSCNI